MMDVIILNTTVVSNDSVPSHEVQANVFCLIGSSLFIKLVFFSAIPVSNHLVFFRSLHNLQVSASNEAQFYTTDPDISCKKEF